LIPIAAPAGLARILIWRGFGYIPDIKANAVIPNNLIGKAELRKKTKSTVRGQTFAPKDWGRVFVMLVEASRITVVPTDMD